MRELSKKTKAEQYNDVARERDVLAQFARYLINRDAPDAVEEITEDAGDGYINRYEFQLYNVLRADGGIVAIIDHIAGQRSGVYVKVFDEWIKEVAAMQYGGMYTEIKIACERLTAARRAIFAREVENAKH